MERNTATKPRRALLSADRDFNHTVSAQIVALNAQGAVMACYMKVPVGQEVYVRLDNREDAQVAVVIPFENIRQLLSAAPSPQISRYQGFAVKFLQGATRAGHH